MLTRKTSFAAMMIAVVVLVYACRKFDATSKQTHVTPTEFKLADAKEWYYGVFKKSADFKQINKTSPFVIKSSIPLQKHPDWRLSASFRKGKFKIVEMPYVATVKTFLPVGEIMRYSLKDKIAIANATINKVLFIEENGKVVIRLVTWIPTLKYAKKKGFDISNSSYNIIESDFSGFLVVRKWDESLINFIELKNGKFEKQIQVKRIGLTVSTNKVESNIEVEDCGYEIPVFGQVCIRWANTSMDNPDGSNGSCAEWETAQIAGIWVSEPCPEDPEIPGDPEDPNGDPYYNCVQSGGDNCTCVFLGLGCDNGDLPPDPGNGGNPPSSPAHFWDPNNPFADLYHPIQIEDEALINNNIIVEDLAFPTPPGPGLPRLIGRNDKRHGNNPEDLQFGVNGDATGIIPELLVLTDDQLFASMREVFTLCTALNWDLRTVGQSMVQKFRDRSGGVFESEVINQNVKIANSFINFCNTFGQRLQSRLESNAMNINTVSTIELGDERPIFNGYHKFVGLQILLNDTEFTEIELLNFILHGNNKWEAFVKVTTIDHFGLDKHDALTYQDLFDNQGWPNGHPGFGSWWILQHKRNYVPYITKITVYKKIYIQ